MRHRGALLSGLAGLGVVALLPGVASARVVTRPVVEVPPFVTLSRPDAGGATGLVTLRWRPPVFEPAAASNQVDVAAYDLTQIAGPSVARAADGPEASTTTEGGIGVRNGHRYLLLVLACEATTALCDFGGSTGGIAVVDATAPRGSMRIEGGRSFVNRNDVALDLEAEDPLIDGRPGTSSGVTQVSVDRDGDGTHPCPPFATADDASSCGVAFAPQVFTTLPPGDGLKVVGVMFGDGAREVARPCTGVLCVVQPRRALLGNASPPVTDTIVLDTVAPSATARASTTTASAGRALGLELASAADGGDPAIASGVDPASARWDLGDGATATGSAITHAYAAPGTYTASVTVADRAGNRSAPSAVTVVVEADPGAAGGTTAPAAVPVVSVAAAAPRITRLRAACAPRRTRTISERRSPCAPALAVSLTRRATLALVVRRAGASRVLARLTRTGPTGASVIVLPRATVSRLGAGSYRIAVTPAGGATATTTVRFPGS